MMGRSPLWERLPEGISETITSAGVSIRYINMVKAGQMKPFLQDDSGKLFEIGTGLQCDAEEDPAIHSLL